jgi:hypothetical protein
LPAKAGIHLPALTPRATVRMSGPTFAGVRPFWAGTVASPFLRGGKRVGCAACACALPQRNLKRTLSVTRSYLRQAQACRLRALRSARGGTAFAANRHRYQPSVVVETPPPSARFGIHWTIPVAVRRASTSVCKVQVAVAQAR